MTENLGTLTQEQLAIACLFAVDNAEREAIDQVWRERRKQMAKSYEEAKHGHLIL